MKLNITFKISAVVVLCLMGMTITAIVLSNRYVMQIIDRKQSEIFTIREARIIADLNRVYNELKASGIEEAYREKAQEDILKNFRSEYYGEQPAVAAADTNAAANTDAAAAPPAEKPAVQAAAASAAPVAQKIAQSSTTSPFILDKDGVVVMHTSLPRSDTSVQKMDFMKTMQEQKNGSQYYTFKGEKKWMTFQYFEPWQWYIGYIITYKDKYADANQLKTMLASTLLGLAFVTIVVISVVSYRMVTVPIKRSADMLRDIAQGEGDLTKRLPENRQDEIGSLSHWFNAFVEKIQAVVRDISSTAGQLNDSSQNLSSTASQMAQGVNQMNQQTTVASASASQMSQQMNTIAHSTEDMSSNVRTVAAAVEEMTTTITEVAQNAEQAAIIADTASKKVEISNQVIGELGTAADEIGKVIEVIKDIAEQTNLLALNATIEAARAGDAGKGFAVVATEVKELARQTAQATESVAKRISAIQDSTSKSIASIAEIRDVIVRVNEVSRNIASAVEEQSVTTREIAQNITQAAKATDTVSQGVQNSARTSGEISQNINTLNTIAGDSSQGAATTQNASQGLATLANKLNTLVGQFKY